MISIRRDPARVAAAEAARLATARTDAVAEVNRLIGDVRARYITITPGQEMVYLTKEAEARAFLSAVDPDPADYPLIEAEIGITAPTAWEVAQLVANLADQWRTIGAGLERLRLGTAAEIAAAPEPTAVTAALDALRLALSAPPSQE